MTSPADDDQLSDYLLGKLTGAEKEVLKEALAKDPVLRLRLRETASALRDLRQVERHRLRDRLKTLDRRPERFRHIILPVLLLLALIAMVIYYLLAC